MEGHATLTLVLALGMGVLAQTVARHLRIPGIVLLLLLGAGLGPDGLAWIEPRSLGQGLFALVDLAVAIILFEGGLNLEIRRLRREQTPIRRLVTWGALVTLVGAAIATNLLLDWSWVQSFLFGSLVVVTGPTVIGPLVRELKLRPRVATVLEAEGVLIDPIGAILAVLVLGLAFSPGEGAYASGALDFALRLGFGTAAGFIAGWALAMLLRTRRLIPEGLENIFTLAAVLLLYQGGEEFIPHSGIVAVTVAGVVVGNLKTRVDRDLREFKDQLTVLLIGLLFILLAADVRLVDVQALGRGGLWVVGALVFLVRPLNVWFSTLGSELNWKERVLISWIAPRGIVAAAVASLAAGALPSGGAELRALVFLTIAVTVVLAGLTSRPVAQLLKLCLPGRERVGILGAHGPGLVLAEELQKADVPVVLLDSNPQNCRRAEDLGLPVIFGNALEERTLQRARFDAVGAAVAVTPNETLNELFVTRARELAAVPETYVALAALPAAVTPEIVRSGDARVLFEGPHDVERWDVRSRHDELAVEHWVFEGREEVEGEPAPESPGERFMIFAIRRGKKAFPMYEKLEPKKGDIASVAVHVPERDDAHRILTQLGWRPHEEATEAE